MITRIDLPCEVLIGRNLVIDHFRKIVIGGCAKCAGVIIRLPRFDEPYPPVIGNNAAVVKPRRSFKR